MNENINENDSYTISCETILSSYDRKIMSLLYQPIIGFQSCAVYFTLWSELDIDRVYTSPNRLKRLMSIMMIDSKTLVCSLNLLEAIGLIKTYYKKDSDYSSFHYLVYSPKTPDMFFKNPLLIKMLTNTLSNDDFIKTKMFFQKNTFDISEYKNISCTYKDMFVMESNNYIHINQDFKKQQFSSVNETIDLSLISDGLKMYNLHNLLLNNDIKNMVEMVILTYDLTHDDVVNLMVECSNTSDKLIDIDLFMNQAKLKADLEKYRSKLVNIHYKDSNSSNVYSRLSVYEFFNKKYAALKVNMETYYRIEKIMNDTKLTNDVVNVLIEYVVKKDGLFKYNYFAVILNEWSKSDVDTFEKAKYRIESIEKNANKSYKSRKNVKTIGNVDNWYSNEEDRNKEVDNDRLEELKLRMKQVSNHEES